MNSNEFGRSLRRLCQDMLAHVVEAYGHGFQDGGCLTLAEALREWSGGALTPGAAYHPKNPGKAQHVFAAYGMLCLDSDGLGTPSDLVAKLDRWDGPGHRTGSYTPANRGDMPLHIELVPWIVKRLNRRFGPYQDDLLGGQPTWRKKEHASLR